MKVRNYLEHIVGVGIYPVITLIIFFTFFSVLLIWVMRSRRHQYNAINDLPLDSGEIAHQTPSSNF